MKFPFLPLILSVAVSMPLMAAEDELAAWLKRSNAVFSAHEAAAVGDIRVLQTAVADKLTLNMPDETGKTPLDIAAANGQVGAVVYLLGSGASPSEQTLRLAANQAIRESVQGALQIRNREVQLCEAVACDNTAEVRKLLSMGVSANALTYDHQQSVLMQAAGNQKTEMVKVLLDAGASPNYVNPQTKSVLHIAAAHGNSEVVKLLLNAGANPMAEASNGATPLHDAVWSQNLATVKALLPAYKSQNYNPDGERNGRPLNMAVHAGRLDIVQAFIDAGTDLRGASFKDEPPLVEAVLYRRLDVARALLKAGADPDAKDKRGSTAREYAVTKMPELFN